MQPFPQQGAAPPTPSSITTSHTASVVHQFDPRQHAAGQPTSSSYNQSQGPPVQQQQQQQQQAPTQSQPLSQPTSTSQLSSSANTASMNPLQTQSIYMQQQQQQQQQQMQSVYNLQQPQMTPVSQVLPHPQQIIPAVGPPGGQAQFAAPASLPHQQQKNNQLPSKQVTPPTSMQNQFCASGLPPVTMTRGQSQSSMVNADGVAYTSPPTDLLLSDKSPVINRPVTHLLPLDAGGGGGAGKPKAVELPLTLTHQAKESHQAAEHPVRNAGKPTTAKVCICIHLQVMKSISLSIEV